MRHFYFPLLISLALLSCTKDNDPGKEDPNPPTPDGYVTFTLDAKPFEHSKASLDGDKLKWSNSDRIMVNGKTCFVTVLKSGEATVSVKQASSYEALYPADIVKDGRMFIQGAQYYSAGSFGEKANPAVGSVDGSTMRFTSLCAVIELPVRGSGEIASINVRDNNGGFLSGSGSVKDGLFVPDGEVKFSDVTLNCKTNSNNGVALSSSGTSFYIVVPAGKYPSGFTVTISSKDGHAMTSRIGSGLDLKAGSIATLDAIDYAIPENQLFAYHFDSFCYGGDPVDGLKGFRSPDKSKPSGSALSNDVSDANEAGADVMTNTTTNGSFLLPQSYRFYRNIQDFTLLCNVQEFHGCLGCGANGLSRATLKLPPFTGIPKGKVCMAEISFRIAAQPGVGKDDIDFFTTYSTPGKVLELWLDGRKVADFTPNKKATGSLGDPSRWASGAGSEGFPSLSSHLIERVRIKASELSDGKWHEARLVMGALASTSTIEIGPHPSTTTSGAFFIDDIVAVRKDYDLPDNFLNPGWINSFSSSATANAPVRLKNHGKVLGSGPYMDLSFSTSFFSSRNWDDATISAEIAKIAKVVSDCGVRVWNIHLPATDPDGSYDKDIFEYFHYDAKVRKDAVDLTKRILKWVKPFESVNLMVHATGPGRKSTDPRFYFENAKDNGVESFKALNTYCQSSEMKYSDGTHPVFCIENIQNTGTQTVNVCALPEYMNYYCSQVPGMKVCYDSSHGQVCGSGGVSSVEYLRRLGTNVCALHMHGNGKTTVDRHLMPGYSNGIYTAGNDDIIDWPEMYKVLIEDCKYTGPFTYEIGTNAEDCIASWSNIVHNYYTVVLEPYKKRYLK